MALHWRTCRYAGRACSRHMYQAHVTNMVGKSLCVAGWVKTGCQQGSGAYEPWAFLELNDGSTLANLQVLTCECQMQRLYVPVAWWANACAWLSVYRQASRGVTHASPGPSWS